MRIISGRYRGKPIIPPKNFKARPTTDQAKEALFNILANSVDFEAVKVLDMFSGTGSISYEFASRGCSDITAVENDGKNAAFIKNISTELQLNIQVIKANVFQFSRFCKTSYDIIFADPPYDLKQIPVIPEMVFEYKMLNDGGWLIIEHSGNNDFSAHPNFREIRNYGKVNFSIFRS